jgi:hypothetical protein
MILGAGFQSKPFIAAMEFGVNTKICGGITQLLQGKNTVNK